MLDISQVVSNNDYDEFVENYVGVVKMDVPSEGFRLSTSEFGVDKYNILLTDTLINDKFGTGRLIKDGEIIERVNLSNGYYGVGKSEEEKIYNADYIGFSRYADEFIASYEKDDRVLVIFENPFKNK